MATEHAHAAGHAAHHDEHVDHQGNANFAVWCGLAALTFTTGTFVASNVYLRAWSPTKFVLDDTLLKDLPYFAVLFSIISTVLLLIAASFFVRDKWRAFNGTLALAALTYAVVLLTQFRLMIWFAGYSKQVATIYAPTAAMQFLLNLVGMILLAVAGWYSSFPNKAHINKFFPVAMNVWLYSAVSGILILIIENVITWGQFAAWCGIKLTS
ncbi:hypothetical protein [Alicyclobacillus macrosporangiidus]|uniref:hypothetical protein n=1 Tax=Alicyclobacillus macrosporangiidus TaxID=392015 RepID=UPI00049678D2|nr:hypothetical protein [Alicyclobacillus macrosporangiidus]